MISKICWNKWVEGLNVHYRDHCVVILPDCSYIICCNVCLCVLPSIFWGCMFHSLCCYLYMSYTVVSRYSTIIRSEGWSRADLFELWLGENRNIWNIVDYWFKNYLILVIIIIDNNHIIIENTMIIVIIAIISGGRWPCSPAVPSSSNRKYVDLFLDHGSARISRFHTCGTGLDISRTILSGWTVNSIHGSCGSSSAELPEQFTHCKHCIYINSSYLRPIFL